MNSAIMAIFEKSVQSSEMSPTSPDEQAQVLGHAYYLLKDEQTMALLLGDPQLTILLPALSHLVRTSRKDKHGIELAKLHWRRALRIQLLVKQRPALVNVARYDSWLIFGYTALDDTLEGWRGKLITERIKTYKIENAQTKTGGLFGWLKR
jgi:hypothetical protein